MIRRGQVVWSVLSLAMLFCFKTSEAEELPRRATLPLALANQAVEAAVEKCAADGYRVSASVVDEGGTLKSFQRADGAGPHTVDSSRKKAYTALSLRRSTAELADLIARVPSLQALRDINDQILILGGGLPIEIAGEIAGEIVGGIGVGGAPGADLDEACARAGLERVGAKAISTK